MLTIYFPRTILDLPMECITRTCYTREFRLLQILAGSPSKDESCVTWPWASSPPPAGCSFCSTRFLVQEVDHAEGALFSDVLLGRQQGAGGGRSVGGEWRRCFPWCSSGRRLVLAACPHRGTQRPQGGPSLGLSAPASVSLVSRHPFLPTGGSRPPSHHSGPESLHPVASACPHPLWGMRCRQEEVSHREWAVCVPLGSWPIRSPRTRQTRTPLYYLCIYSLGASFITFSLRVA